MHALSESLTFNSIKICGYPCCMQASTLEERRNCTNLVRTNNMCSSTVIYQGQVCSEYLHAFQSCVTMRAESREIYIPPQGDQNSAESQALVLTGSGLQLVSSSPECEMAIRPFLCLYLFRLCDGDGGLYEPSCGQCVSIRDDICAREWVETNQLLQRFGKPTLPVCETFPDPAGECNSELLL